MIIRYIVTTINKVFTYEYNESLMKKYNFNLKKDIKERKKSLAHLHKCKKEEITLKIYKDGKDVTKCYLS